jgi:tetratricopeptide (TPR) repeat protein
MMRATMKSTLYHALWALALGAGMAACKGPAASVKQPPPSGGRATELGEESRMTLTYHFFNANKEKILGNTDKAMDLFAQCIRIDNRNAASMYELAALYAEKKKFNDALFFAQSAAEIEPDNGWYQLLLADLYRQTGKFGESLAVYERLVRRHPDRIDYYYNWANALLYAGKLQEAIGVFDQIEEKTGVDRDLIVQKERLYLKLGKVDEAARELEKLIAANPGAMESWSLLVELYQANAQKEKALETIRRMQAVNPESPHVYLALAEYYRSNDENEKSFEQLKLAFASPRLDSDVKLRIIGSYVPLAEQDEKMLGQALELGAILAETHPGEAMSHAAYGDFLVIAGKHAEAAGEFKKVLALDPSNESVWQSYLVCTERLRDFPEMEDVSSRAMELFPNNPFYYLYNGLAKGSQDRHGESVRTLAAGAKLVVENDRLLAEFYAMLGDHYHELGNHAESDAHYEKALKIEPDRATTLNNYAYYLSLRREKLDRAAAMSKRSNELVPGQASFEDTYGWILYQQGDYAGAREWLEKALGHGGDGNGTILEHYGDVLYKLGDTAGALEQWRKAKAAGDTSGLIDAKIAGQKLVE